MERLSFPLTCILVVPKGCEWDFGVHGRLCALRVLLLRAASWHKAWEPVVRHLPWNAPSHWGPGKVCKETMLWFSKQFSSIFFLDVVGDFWYWNGTGWQAGAEVVFVHCFQERGLCQSRSSCFVLEKSSRSHIWCFACLGTASLGGTGASCVLSSVGFPEQWWRLS